MLQQKVWSGLSGLCRPKSKEGNQENLGLSDIASALANLHSYYRGLDFTAQSLRHNINNASKELSESFRDAYGNTLKKHHSFIIKPIFSAAMSATPYRKDFYAKLGSDDAKVKASLEREVAALEERVTILKSFQDRKEAKW
jgi:hypothetical protein